MSQPLADVQLTLKRKVLTDLRWNDPNEFVLSLVSFGETTPDRLAVVPSLVEAAVRGHGPINLKLEGLSGLPNNVQPRYICINISGDVQKLMALQASIQRSLVQLTGPPDGKGFQPHVVLGRIKKESDQERVALGRGMRLLMNTTGGAFTMDSVGLIRNMAAEGVSYAVMKSIPLVG